MNASRLQLVQVLDPDAVSERVGNPPSIGRDRRTAEIDSGLLACAHGEAILVQGERTHIFSRAKEQDHAYGPHEYAGNSPGSCSEPGAPFARTFFHGRFSLKRAGKNRLDFEPGIGDVMEAIPGIFLKTTTKK
jgi:hypothetical protein